jgi:hypothetical protein
MVVLKAVKLAVDLAMNMVDGLGSMLVEHLVDWMDVL